MTILDRILEKKREEVAEAKISLPLERLQQSPLYDLPAREFAAALRSRTPSVIAEIKKASPSRGVIRQDFDPALLSRQLEAGGAAALSVLTDVEFFQGAIRFLTVAKERVRIPVLRKDFIVDPYQLHEAKAAGADAVLLIVAALPHNDLVSLSLEARTLGLACLVEVHTDEEAKRAVDVGASIVGVNNRDLRTFAVDLSVCERVARVVPPECIVVSESGVKNGGDMRRLMKCGVCTFLIGEMLMRHPSPGDALRELLAAAAGGCA